MVCDGKQDGKVQYVQSTLLSTNVSFAASQMYFWNDTENSRLGTTVCLGQKKVAVHPIATQQTTTHSYHY